MARLQERYQKEIVQQLATKLNRTNVLSLPRLQKICVNMGVGKALQDKNRMEQAADQLSQITGQKSQIRKAKVAVSGFRLRENQDIALARFHEHKLIFTISIRRRTHTNNLQSRIGISQK